MEIIKQLYDIGTVFNHCTNMNEINAAFSSFAIAQLENRELGNEKNIVLDDIYKTALTICTRGKDGGSNFEILLQGIRQVNSFIFSQKYHIEKALLLMQYLTD